eukprot:scaffold192973_cov34-Tisochrysis_lutea.AAC.2
MFSRATSFLVCPSTSEAHAVAQDHMNESFTYCPVLEKIFNTIHELTDGAPIATIQANERLFILPDIR